MAQYMWSTMGAFQNTSLLYVVNDDIRVSGEKNQFGVAWSHENQVAPWLVPQASHGDFVMGMGSFQSGVAALSWGLRR